MSVRFAIAGYGYIGKRHAEMIRKHPQAELVAIADIRPESDLFDGASPVPCFETVDSLLANGPDFDVLCVATPNGYHAEHALRALQERRHVVIEKPMALKKADCEKIILTALSVQRLVFCVMQNRYSPPSQWIRQLVTDGTLGEIYMVQVNCFWNRDERYYRNNTWKGRADLDGGILFTQFSHFIDIMYWLFGDISDIKATFADFNHRNLTEFEDSGLVNFRFNNGGIGSINYSTSVWDKNFESSITILAEKGTIKIGGQYMNEVEYCHIRDYVMPELPPANPANDYGPYKGSAANHNYVFDNVIDAVMNGGTPTTNAMEGLKVVEIIENIYAQNPFFSSKKDRLSQRQKDF